MNILSIYYRIIKKLTKVTQTLWFLFVKKPLYYISYNSNGNRFQCKGLMFNTSVKIMGGGNQVLIDEGVRLKNMKIVVSGKNNKLIIHKNVLFHEGGRVKLEDENNLIEIGEGTDFVDCFFAVSDYDSKVIIGKNCMFSAKIIIRNSDVHSILNVEGKRINPARDTIIDDRVWIGYGATILKGCHIGNDAIIGTQSVVAGNVPDGCVAAGNPAKTVKQGVHWNRERLR